MGQRAVILLVDDDSDVRSLCRKALDRPEYLVQEASDGSVLIDRLQSGDRPDVVVLDILMPESTGWAVLSSMRRTGDLGKVRIVMLTSYADADFRQRARELGVAAYLTKPFAGGELLSAVRSALLPPDDDPWSSVPR